MAEACVTALIFRLTDLYTAYAGDYKGTETYGKREEGVFAACFYFFKKIINDVIKEYMSFFCFCLIPNPSQKIYKIKSDENIRGKKYNVHHSVRHAQPLRVEYRRSH